MPECVLSVVNEQSLWTGDIDACRTGVRNPRAAGQAGVDWSRLILYTPVAGSVFCVRLKAALLELPKTRIVLSGFRIVIERGWKVLLVTLSVIKLTGGSIECEEAVLPWCLSS